MIRRQMDEYGWRTEQISAKQDGGYNSRHVASYLYLDLVVRFAVVDADDAANHLRYDNHVTQVRLHTLQRACNKHMPV